MDSEVDNAGHMLSRRRQSYCSYDRVVADPIHKSTPAPLWAELSYD
jgi:hypothetical protein